MCSILCTWESHGTSKRLLLSQNPRSKIILAPATPVPMSLLFGPIRLFLLPKTLCPHPFLYQGARITQDDSPDCLVSPTTTPWLMGHTLLSSLLPVEFLEDTSSWYHLRNLTQESVFSTCFLGKWYSSSPIIHAGEVCAEHRGRAVSGLHFQLQYP